MTKSNKTFKRLFWFESSIDAKRLGLSLVTVVCMVATMALAVGAILTLLGAFIEGIWWMGLVALGLAYLTLIAGRIANLLMDYVDDL